MKKIKIFKMIGTLLFFIVLIILFRSFFISSYMIDGHSMEPNLKDGDKVLVNHFESIISPPRKGDVYFFDIGADEPFVKTIVAVPGDYIKVSHNKLFVNGRDTNYKSSTMRMLLGDEKRPYRTLGKNCYLVLGENLEESTDSRTFGCIRSGQMLGKVITKF